MITSEIVELFYGINIEMASVCHFSVQFSFDDSFVFVHVCASWQ